MLKELKKEICVHKIKNKKIKTNDIYDIQIDDKNKKIKTNDIYDIQIDDKNKKITIDLNYDLYINIIGELGISTLNNLLCLDTINSNLMLNSRASKELFDTEEAINYRNNIIKKQLDNNKCENNEINDLKNLVNSLKSEISMLKEYVYGK